MENYYWVAIAAVIVAVLAVFLVLRGRAAGRQDISTAHDTDTIAPSPTPASVPGSQPTQHRAAQHHATQHHEGVADAAAVATADIAGQFLGIDTTPGPPDDLTRIKGLGPKAAGVLSGIGVKTYAQLAALTPGQVSRVDAAMGNLAGRIHRDQWLEQARLLSMGDIPGFEAKFGKLGG